MCIVLFILFCFLPISILEIFFPYCSSMSSFSYTCSCSSSGLFLLLTLIYFLEFLFPVDYILAYFEGRLICFQYKIINSVLI